ncbi:MAG TPA: MarR family transcriptional regulator [Elusimicrobiota bacterium]|nr:MarR family transcriptional regulator [Elusimicrobiota bacterium]
MSRVGYLLNRTALEIRQRAQETLRPLDMIPPHLAVLSTLAAGGPQTQRDLGAAIRIDPTTMVWLIDHLEKKAWVRRGRHPVDRRAHLVELTPAGNRLFQQAAARLDALEREFLRPLSAGEREALVRLLGKLFQHVATRAIPPRFFSEHRKAKS